MDHTAIEAARIQQAEDKRMRMTCTAKHLRSQMNQGVLIHWFNVNGTVYGLNSGRGIIDRDGWGVGMIPASVAVSIMLAAQKIDREGPYRPCAPI